MVLDGHPDAYSDGIVAFIPRLRRLALALANDADAADEVVMACLAQASADEAGTRLNGSLPLGLFRTLYRQDIEKAAGGSAGSRGGNTSQVNGTGIADALPDLDPAERFALLLVAVENMSYEDAAAVLDITVPNLRRRLAHGRSHLRELMGQTHASEGNPR